MLTIQVGHMIQAESDNTKRDEYLKRLMSLPNQVSCFVF
jgi:exportin-1